MLIIRGWSIGYGDRDPLQTINEQTSASREGYRWNFPRPGPVSRRVTVEPDLDHVTVMLISLHASTGVEFSQRTELARGGGHVDCVAPYFGAHG